MNRGLSLRRRNESRSNKREENTPLVICIDKDEQAEMGLCQSANNNSQTEDTESSSQDRNGSSSPILFPSPQQRNDDEVMEDKDDCLKIVDKGECTEDTKKIETPEKDVPSHSRMQMFKGTKACLSLGRKRHVDCESNKGGDNATRPKERRLMFEEKYTKNEHDENSNAFPQKESVAVMHPLTLHRSYKCKHKVCQTLEEADKMDLYFAPPGIKESQYSQVIVRKFESYRQRLYHAQSSLIHYHPYGGPIEPGAPRPRTRAKRASVLRKNAKAMDDLESKKDTIDLVENSEISKEIECSNDVDEQAAVPEVSGINEQAAVLKVSGVDEQTAVPEVSGVDEQAAVPEVSGINEQTAVLEVSGIDEQTAVLEVSGIDEQTAVLKVSGVDEKSAVPEVSGVDEQAVVLQVIYDDGDTNQDTRTPQPLSSNSPKQKDVDLTTNNDVVIETIRNDKCLQSVQRTSNESRSSPVKPRLRKNIRHTILNEMSSDEELPYFSLTKPKETAKQESVIVSSKENAPMARRLQHHECPMCYNMFPEDKIETHAAMCNGSGYEIVTRSARDTPLLEQDEVLDHVSQRSDRDVFSSGKNIQEHNKMSPIIKVRTPTKVRELKLMEPSLAVRNLAHEFSSQPKPGEPVQMFGNNVILSPRAASVAEDAIMKKSFVSSMEKQNDFVKSKRKDNTKNMASRRSDVIMETTAAYKVSDSPKRTESGKTAKIDIRQSTIIPKGLNAKKPTTRRLSASELLQVLHGESPSSTASTRIVSDVKRPWSSEKDFIPLESDREEHDIEKQEDNSLPSKNIEQTSSVTSVSSSEDESNETVVRTRSKILNDDEALDLLNSGYKGRKRKRTENVVRETRKKLKDDSVEFCSFCRKYIPSMNYGKHIDEEIAERRKKQNNEGRKVCESSPSSHEPETSTMKNNLKSWSFRQREVKQPKCMLPDFAEATVSNVNKDDDFVLSPLKTFEPLDRFPNLNIDYHNQFTPNSGSSGRGQPWRKRKRARKRK